MAYIIYNLYIWHINYIQALTTESKSPSLAQVTVTEWPRCISSRFIGYSRVWLMGNGCGLWEMGVSKHGSVTLR